MGSEILMALSVRSAAQEQTVSSFNQDKGCPNISKSKRGEFVTAQKKNGQL